MKSTKQKAWQGLEVKHNGRTTSICKSQDSNHGTEKLGKHYGTQDVEAEGSVVQDQPGAHSNARPVQTSEEDFMPKQEV